jgi:hypothetical protein
MAVHDLALETLQAQRLERWRQTPRTRIAGPDDAVALIEQVGVATLYPASPEIPNLYHAYMGDPAAPTSPEWDSPSGEVYTWRWTLGQRSAAAYLVLVRNRPTLVRWSLFPAVLRLIADPRTPDELYAAGALSADAHRVAQALEEAGGALSTGDLRRAADFPTGRTSRAAYLKAVDELDRLLLLAKVFAPGEDDLRHALIQQYYAEHAAAAARLTREEALASLLATYLPCAAYAVAAVLARHLKLPEAELRAGLDRLVAGGHAAAFALPGQKGTCYRWTGACAP